MKKQKIASLVLGAALMSGTAALANSQMKCGAGKCGGNMGNQPKTQQPMKCGAGKCGGNMGQQDRQQDQNRTRNPQMKCGAGKCGAGMSK
ncbi:MAG: hypothetical protein AB7E49_07665 [Campylobacterales bacterium]